jgi:phosphonate transport system substrate-binding protein
MAGQPQPFYKGQFIANVDAGVATFADLKGKTFCIVDPNSTSGYVMPSIILKANGIDPEVDLTIHEAGSHDNVAIGVYDGTCDAGATYVNVLTDSVANLAATYPDIAEKVKPFAVTEQIPNDGMQVIAGLDPTLRDAIVNGVLFMTTDPGGKAVLKGLYNYDSLVAVEPDFYDNFLGVLQQAGIDPATLVK